MARATHNMATQPYEQFKSHDQLQTPLCINSLYILHKAGPSPQLRLPYIIFHRKSSQTYMCKHSVDIVWLFPLQKYSESVSCGVWGEQVCV